MYQWLVSQCQKKIAVRPEPYEMPLMYDVAVYESYEFQRFFIFFSSVY